MIQQHLRRKHCIKMASMTTAAVLSCVMLGGCGGGQSKAPETPEEFHAAMVERSVLSVGNTARIGTVLDRAAAGEDLTFAYVGGSITEGYAAGARSPQCYASLSAAQFQETYCKGGSVTCQNNGLSGTPSILGNLRAPSEVYATAPDVIFIEFAVNDGMENDYKVAYESLVKSALELEQAPAVILLFTYMENGHTCQEQQSEIGAHYDLGMISVRDAILPELEAGRMAWSDYGDDDVHPSVQGHALLAECIAEYFAQAAEAKRSKSYELPAETVHPTCYEHAQLLDTTSLTYQNGSWALGTSNQHFGSGFAHAPEAGNAPLSFTVTGKQVFLVYTLSSSVQYGMCGVRVNGHLEDTINGCGANGWGGPAVKLVYESDRVETLDIEIAMLDDHAEKTFEVLAIGVCE